ncbi:hypothetical protein KPL78_20810 [Roseomonas sp. HJA6]|uniref:Type I restriction modification DNA specificity domain-containing protein n=1 Tax=Roseomonas alba TaxID=2846776 RepID=A0ABS7ADD4_9PROT|nr:hypothetical protein [Neoroseomonas alba]MBW6400314.1 hypothetical protein [Neoroseomonas alba]
MDALPGETPPPGWAVAPLGDLIKGIEAGKNVAAIGRPPEDSETGIVKVSAVTWGEFDEDESKALPPGAAIDPAHLIRPGDFLISRANTIELVGAPVIVKQFRRRLVLSDKVLRLRVVEGFDRWLELFLKSHFGRVQIEQYATGAQLSMRNISQENLRRITLPVPPEAEQTRIVAAVNALFEDVEAGEAALARAREGLTQFRASLLHAACTGALTADWRAANPTNETGEDLLHQLLAARSEDSSRRARAILAPDVTDEAPLPSGWCWASVDQVTNFLGNGLARAPDGDTTDRRILRISAVRPLKVDHAEHRFYRPLPAENLAGATTQRHDLLVTRYSGSEQYVGVCGLVRFDEPLLFPDKVMCARPLPGFSDLAEYLEVALNAGPSRAYIARNIRTTAGQKGIAGSSIRACPVPLPPRRELVAIVAAVREAQTDATELPADEFAARLRQSILHAAFTGRLVPQDPADEPAAALLARLRAAPATTRRPRQRRAAAPPDLIETPA